MFARILPQLRRFAGRSPADQRLLARAGMALLLCRVGVAAMPLRRMARLTGGLPRRRHPAESPARIAWAVRAAGRQLLGDSSCLSQALAARALLSREGYPSQLRVGMTRDHHGAVTGHAWIEAEGDTFLDADGLELQELPLDQVEGFS